MSTLRPFRADDLFKFNNINLDPLTETYHIPFYLGYLAQWPSICATYEDHTGRLAGYILGKAEGDGKLWHGHVTAVTGTLFVSLTNLIPRLIQFTTFIKFPPNIEG